MTSLRLKWGRAVLVGWSWGWRFILYSLIISIVIGLLVVAASREASSVSLSFPELFLELFLGYPGELFLGYPGGIFLGDPEELLLGDPRASFLNLRPLGGSFLDVSHSGESFLDRPEGWFLGHQGVLSGLPGAVFLGHAGSVLNFLVGLLVLKIVLEIHVPLLISTSPSDNRLVSQRNSASKPVKNGERETAKLRLTWVRVVLVWWSWVWRSVLYVLILSIIELLVLNIIGPLADRTGLFTSFSPDVQAALALSGVLSLALVYFLVVYLLSLKRALEVHVPLLASTGTSHRPVPGRKKRQG